MDDLVEWGLHALRAFMRAILHVFFEFLFEHMIEPLGRLIAAIYRLVRDALRVIVRIDFVANLLAVMVLGAVFAGPLFILGKAFESYLMGH